MTTIGTLPPEPVSDTSRVRPRIFRYLFRCADGHYLAAADAAFGTEVYYLVSGFDDVHVVLDDDQACRRCRSALGMRREAY